MSDFLGSIGNFFSSSAGKGVETLAGLGATGSGLVGNLLADKQRSDAANLAKKNANLTPQQLGAMVTGATQPLDRSLVQAITGNVDASLAEQGLSQAPGLIATATSQALAPYQQMNQQTALQLVLRKLGLPAEYAATVPQNAQLAPLIAMLFKGFGNNSTPARGGALPETTGPTLDQLGAPPTYGDTSGDPNNYGINT
jgi:hypothetical protein